MTDKVLTILEELVSCPEDYDLLKTAAELREIIQAENKEDLTIAENIKDFWTNRADHAE